MLPGYQRAEFVSDKRYNKSIKSQNGNYTIEVLCVVFRQHARTNLGGSDASSVSCCSWFRVPKASRKTQSEGKMLH